MIDLPEVPERILLPRFDAFGDIILLEGFVEALLQRFPKTQAVILVRPGYEQLAPLFPPALKWHTCPVNPPAPGNIGEQLQALADYFRRERYDIVLGTCYDQTWADTTVGLLTHGQARRVTICGPDGPAVLPVHVRSAAPCSLNLGEVAAWDEVVEVDRHSQETRKYQQLWCALTGSSERLPDPQLRVPRSVTELAMKLARDMRVEPGAYVSCCPVGTQNVAIKAWPPDRFVEVIVWLERTHRLPALLVGHHNERAALEAMLRLAERHGTHPRLWTGGEGDIPLLAGFIAQSQLYVGNDTGPMHMAAALGVPAVSVFGGGHWPRFTPSRNTCALVRELPCFGCDWQCIFDEAVCVQMVPVDTVLEAIEEVIRHRPTVNRRTRVVELHTPLESTQLEALIGRASRHGRESTRLHQAARAALFEQVHELTVLLAESESDRAARLQNIQRLGELLNQCESDRTSRFESIHRLERMLAESEADRAERLAQVHRLGGLLQESESDRASRLESVHQLERMLAESEADRAERLVEMHRLGGLLQESEDDRAARLKSIHQLEQILAELRADRVTQGEEIQRLEMAVQRGRDDQHGMEQLLTEAQADRDLMKQNLEAQSVRLGELEARRALLQNELAEARDQASVQQSTLAAQEKLIAEYRDRTQRLQWRLAVAGSAVKVIRESRTYRLRRKMGRWEGVERLFAEISQHNGLERKGLERVQEKVKESSGHRSPCIAVDMTPLLPGGENGGTKMVAMGLVRHLSQLAADHRFVLLTADRAHEELAVLDAPNVRRLCVTKVNWRARLASILPKRVLVNLRFAYRLFPWPAGISDFHSVGHRPRLTNVLKEIGADLLFCPFTAPFFYDPTVPVVSVVHDLQYQYYSQFFDPDERSHRDAHFRNACQVASRLICVSEYVRKTVLEKSTLGVERVRVVHTRLFDRLPQPSTARTAQVLAELGLAAGRFLLYPANFWPHKNHRMLFTAFGIYRARHPQSDLRLVCTGAPDARMEALRDATARARLDGWIAFPGFVSDEEFTVLLQSSLGVIFPSLYEGFGMPVLEAMALGKPVLCSNVTSLPEIAGDAAIFFDPRKPMDIVQGIERLEGSPDLARTLADRGRRRVAEFGDATEMAREYLRVFHEVMSAPIDFSDGVQGVYPDGWTEERVVITYGSSQQQRALEISLTAPSWLPSDRIAAQLTNGSELIDTWVVARGETETLRLALPQQSGCATLMVDPVFQPKALGMNDDERRLGCLCNSCRLVLADRAVDLLSRRAG